MQVLKGVSTEHDTIGAELLLIAEHRGLSITSAIVMRQQILMAPWGPAAIAQILCDQIPKGSTILARQQRKDILYNFLLTRRPSFDRRSGKRSIFAVLRDIQVETIQ